MRSRNTISFPEKITQRAIAHIAIALIKRRKNRLIDGKDPEPTTLAELVFNGANFLVQVVYPVFERCMALGFGIAEAFERRKS